MLIISGETLAFSKANVSLRHNVAAPGGSKLCILKSSVHLVLPWWFHSVYVTCINEHVELRCRACVRACVCVVEGSGPVITHKFTQNENMYSVLTVFDHNM